MTGNVKTIKFLLLPTLAFITLNYVFDVHTNINNNFITTDFLTTIFAGLFTSAMIVLMLELQKYFFNKNNAEAYLFNCLIRIYTELSMSRGIIQSYIENSDEIVPKELLSNRLPFINQSLENISMIDYSPFAKKNILYTKLNSFKQTTAFYLNNHIKDFNYLKIVINQENIAFIEKRDEHNQYVFEPTSKNENIRSTLKKLAANTNTHMTSVDSFLNDIDLLCKKKYGWSKYKKTIDNQKYDITEQHKITEDFIRN